MSVINKKLYENAESQKKAIQITWEIADCFHQIGMPAHKAFPLIPYLLHKVSLYNDPFGITLQAIVDGKIDIPDDVRLLAQEVLNDKLWNRLLQMVTKYSPEEFALAAVMPVTDYEPKKTMATSTPDAILKLAHKLLDVKAGEKVADVCCGSGAYIVSAALEEANASYHGYEIHRASGAAALMKAELLGADVKVTLGDVFAIADSNEMPKYDKVFADPPFGLKLKDLGVGDRYLDRLAEQYPGLSKGTSAAWVFNALLYDMLAENGKAIAIMTNGSTWNGIDIPMRKYFVERKMVECVIALPSKLFASTIIPTTLIVLSHNNDAVRMIDATKHCQQGRRQNDFSSENIETIVDALTEDYDYSRSISIEELRENDYALHLSRYVADDLGFHNGVPFESVIKSISRGAPCTASQLDEMVSDDVTDMQYLMLANIQDGMIDDKLPYLSYIDPKYEKYCLKNNALILSKNGFPYKVAVASVQEGQRILANGNLYIIELDEAKADPFYVKAFFDSEQGRAALKNITVGAAMPNIGVDNLKKVEIPLPDIEVQKRVAQKYRYMLNEIAATKRYLGEMISRLYRIFDEEST